LSAALICLCSISVTVAEDLAAMEAEIAKLYAKHISDVFQKDLKNPAVKFEANSEKAKGFHVGHDGILMVPSKALKEGEIDPNVESENGAGVCFLFMSKCYQPLVNGKPIDESKLHTVKFNDGDGNSQEAIGLILTVKHVGGDDWRLFAFGKDKKPLISSPFGGSSGGATDYLDIKADSPKDMKSNLTLTIAKKYSASFPIAAK